MSEENKEKQEGNTPKKPETYISGKVPITFDTEPFDNIVHAIGKKSKAQEREDKQEKGFSERQAEAQEGANAINNGLFLTNIGMCAVTFLLFCLNYCGLNSARQSAKSADSLVTIQNRQFQIINEPNLNIGSIHIPDAEYNWRWIALTYVILDFSNHPVYIYYNQVGFRYDTASVAEIMDSMKRVKYSEVKFYVDAAHPFLRTLSLERGGLDSSKIDKMRNGNCTFYGDFVYKNTVTGTMRSYMIIVRLKAIKGNSESMILDKIIYNTNRDTVYNWIRSTPD